MKKPPFYKLKILSLNFCNIFLIDILSSYKKTCVKNIYFMFLSLNKFYFFKFYSILKIDMIAIIFFTQSRKEKEFYKQID